MSRGIQAYLGEIGRTFAERPAPWGSEPRSEANRADRLREEGHLANESTNVAKLGSLVQFAASIAANTQELPHLEQSCNQFVSMVGSLQESSKQQAALVASKQEASKKFRGDLRECERLATVLRAAIKQHYGIRSEKLAEYNLQPFRGRKASEKSKKKQQQEPSPVQPQPESAEAQ